MKLARINKPLRSVQLRVMLAGDLNPNLNATPAFMSTFMASLWTSGRSFQKSFALFSTPTVSFSRRRAHREGSHTASPHRLPRPTTTAQHRRDLPYIGTG